MSAMSNHPHGFTEEDAPEDRALDALLGKASTPRLRAGFAERVLQAVHSEDVSQHPSIHLSPKPHRNILSLPSKRVALFAALLTLSVGALFLQRPYPTPEPATETMTALPSQAAETALLQTLQSNTLTADDLMLVSTLGEALRSDFAAQQSIWPD